MLEMTWSRPTCEINGMGGGYQGEGFKTVIPSKASAKISFRLVFDQDPHAIRKSFREFVRQRLPADCKVEFIEHGSGRAIRFPIEAPAFAKTSKALTDEWGRGAVFIGGGGSIPVTHELKTALGMDVVLAGFALDDDRIHSPEREVRAGELPPRHALLGASAGRTGRPEAGWRGGSKTRSSRRAAPHGHCPVCRATDESPETDSGYTLAPRPASPLHERWSARQQTSGHMRHLICFLAAASASGEPVQRDRGGGPGQPERRAVADVRPDVGPAALTATGGGSSSWTGSPVADARRRGLLALLALERKVDTGRERPGDPGASPHGRQHRSANGPRPS